MSTQKVVGPLVAPLLGSLVLVLFFLVNYFSSFPAAWAISFGSYLIYSIVLRFYVKQEPSYLLPLIFLIFLLFLFLFLINPIRILYADFSGVVFGLCIIAVFSLFNVFKSFFRRKLQHLNDVTREFKIIRFDFDVYVIRVFLVILVLHLLIVLVYQLFPDKNQDVNLDRFVYHILLFILLAVYYLYEIFHIYHIRRIFRNENWLPIVNESGGVRGRIAESVSKEMGNKHLHPIVRIALIYKGRLYLQNRTDEEVLDYPFESDIVFGETLDSAVDRSFTKKGENKDLPSHFIFRYVMKNKKVNRLVYLYNCLIKDEKIAQSLRLKSGKWWTVRQIEENLNAGVFSEYFEKEYELLNKTVLLADRIYGDLEMES